MASTFGSARKSQNSALLVLAVVLFSALAGLLASLSSIEVDLILVGLVLGSTVLFISIDLISWGYGVLCFLIVGQLLYFGRIQNALWLPYLVGYGLYLRLPLEYLKHTRDRINPMPNFPALVVPVYLFIASVMVSSALNLTPAVQILAGSRVYIACWSYLFILLLNHANTLNLLDKQWHKLFAITVIQLPFVMYQYLVIVPTRSTAGGREGVAWDAVVGGFGGDPMGGGYSGSLAYFLVLTLTLVILMWRKKQSSIWLVFFVGFMAMLVILLAEVKVVIVMVPMVMMLIYRKEAFKNPVVFAFALIFAFGIMVGVLQGYQLIYPESASESHDMMEMFDKAFGYSLNTDATAFNQETKEISRAMALIFWWSENGFDDIVHTLFGYGPGASNSLSSFAVSELSARYPFIINRAAASQILWDLGLLGFLSYLALLLMGAWRAMKLIKTVPQQQFASTALETSAIGLLLMLVMLPYGLDILYSPAMQLLLTSMLAYIGAFDMLKAKKPRFQN